MSWSHYPALGDFKIVFVLHKGQSPPRGLGREGLSFSGGQPAAPAFSPSLRSWLSSLGYQVETVLPQCLSSPRALQPLAPSPSHPTLHAQATPPATQS